MTDKNTILNLIKQSVKSVVPDATIILYGSYARGNYSDDSDIDLLVLVEKEKVTRTVEKQIKYPLYDIEFETGTIISPLVLSKKEWETRHRITPFYDNVAKEGVLL